MRILTIHTYYRQPGGEDEVVAAEADLLRRRGHKVTTVAFRNDDLLEMPPWAHVGRLLWNGEAVREVRSAIRSERPAVVHVHNTFAAASPAVIRAASDEGVPVVVSLHNPRLICPSANFHRQAALCVSCLRWGSYVPGVVRGCYHGSRLETLGVALTNSVHWWAGTWDRVTKYVVFTDFYRRLFERGGLPAEKLVVKPHFIPDPRNALSDFGHSCRQARKMALFVGRLDPEKGVSTMLHAWAILKSRGIHCPLRVRGEGRLLDWARKFVATERLPIEFIERVSKSDLYRLMMASEFLVWPSEGWYETFGLVVAEAFACGTPAVAAATGVGLTMISDGRTGLHFRPGDAEDLAAKVEWLLAHAEDLARMRREARAEYEAKYTAERNYEMLMRIYEEAIEAHRRRAEA
ncbi:MAG TPA: glycosyltransferase family 1 protein [Rhodospirillales bacterium]|nr:glycosyltransferase family 1 protein [Rhodospirillales bacterium]